MNPSFEERLTAFLAHQGERDHLFDGLVDELAAILTRFAKHYLGSSASAQSAVEKLRQRFLPQEPAKHARASAEAPASAEPLPMSAEEEANELVRRLYVRLGLISNDLSSPQQR